MRIRLCVLCAILLGCGSDDGLNALSSGEGGDFATSSELRTQLVGGYWKLQADGSSDSWRFLADGGFERRTVQRTEIGWSSRSIGATPWTIEDNGVVKVDQFTYAAGETGPVWFRVQLTPTAATFITTGDSPHRLTYGDFERTP